MLELERERPCGRVHSLIISLPETVHNLDIGYCRLVEDGGAVIFVAGYEVEMRCYGGQIEIVILPDAILQLDHCILDHESDG